MAKKQIKVLYSALEYDYGDKTKGHSFEYYNFYDTLRRMPNVSLIHFPYEKILEIGKEKFNAELLDLVKREKPDIFFTVLFRDELDYKVLDEIKNNTISIAWNSDDHWRLDNYSRHYAPHFTWITTTDSRAPEKYRQYGIKNVIKTQWGANHWLYQPSGGRVEHEVTFIGQPHSNRRQVIGKIAQAGIKVECWGGGWANGRVSQEDMIKIFSQSRINLNLTKSSGFFSLKSVARVFLGRHTDRSLYLHTPQEWVDNYKSLLGHQREQIKGRNFEIPSCGGFLLTGNADNLEEYYVDGKEVVIFEDEKDLLGKISYYLKHEEERTQIAQAGYQRTLKDHTYEKRFEHIFSTVNV